MKTKSTHVFAKITSVFSVFVLMSILFTTTVSASWYGWTYATFNVSVIGTEHYYDGNNVGLNWGETTHNSSPNHINNRGGFTITLERKGWFGMWATIGSVTVDRNSGGNANWTNVGPGTYRFCFSKANDGTTQYVTDIEMFSW